VESSEQGWELCLRLVLAFGFGVEQQPVERLVGQVLVDCQGGVRRTASRGEEVFLEHLHQSPASESFDDFGVCAEERVHRGFESAVLLVDAESRCLCERDERRPEEAVQAFQQAGFERVRLLEEVAAESEHGAQQAEDSRIELRVGVRWLVQDHDLQGRFEPGQEVFVQLGFFESLRFGFLVRKVHGSQRSSFGVDSGRGFFLLGRLGHVLFVVSG